MCFVIPKSKINIIVNITAKNLKTIVYIIPRKIFKTRAFSVMKNFFVLALIIFIYIIPIITLDKKEFGPYCLLN